MKICTNLLFSQYQPPPPPPLPPPLSELRSFVYRQSLLVASWKGVNLSPICVHHTRSHSQSHFHKYSVYTPRTPTPPPSFFLSLCSLSIYSPRAIHWVCHTSLFRRLYGNGVVGNRRRLSVCLSVCLSLSIYIYTPLQRSLWKHFIAL